MSRSNILVQWLCSVLNRKVPHQQFACFISHSSGAPSPTVESLFSRSFIHPRFQFPIHPMTWLLAEVTHLIHPRHPSHNSSQECFCYFIHFNPIHGIGCGWVRARTYYWFLRCLLLVQHLSNLSRVTLPFIGRHLSQIHARQRRQGGGKKPRQLSSLIFLWGQQNTTVPLHCSFFALIT